MAAYYLNKFKGNTEYELFYTPVYVNTTDKSYKIRMYIHNAFSSLFSSPIYVNQTISEYLLLDSVAIVGSALIGNVNVPAGEMQEIKDILIPPRTGIYLYGLANNITIEVFGEDV